MNVPELTAEAAPRRSSATVSARRAVTSRRETRELVQGPDGVARTALQRMLRSGALQPRLSVNPPDDAYEREAERTADRVTQMSGEPSAASRFPSEETPVQRAPSGAAGPDRVGAGVESDIARMSAGGDALPDAPRAYFEPRFGYDFGAVRTHTGPEAEGAAAALQARAFTVGQHIFFGGGQYQPDSASGRRLLAHELTHTIQQTAAPARAQRDFLDDPKGAVLGKLREWALELPPYELLTVILGKDPFTDQAVERTAVTYVHAVLKLVPDGEAIFADLQQSKAIEKTAEWFQGEVARLDITWAGITRLFGEAWDSLDALDVVRPAKVWEKVRTVFSPPLARLTRFALALGGKLVETIKEKALAKLSAWAQTIPGFLLLTFILGRNPITDQAVERTARTFVKAVLELVPGGQGIFENLEKTRTIERTVQWLEAEIAKLDLTVDAIKALFRKAWDVLGVADLLDPLGLVDKLREIFLPPARRVLGFALAVGKKVLEFIFEGAMLIAGPLGEQIVRIARKIGDTFTRIVEDPVGFVRNLIEALKKGFGQFAANILDHLKTGLFEWLFGALEGAGLQLPTKWDLQGILSLVLQVLGITYARMRAKMVKLIGEPRVAFLEKAFDFLKALVTRGPIAAWERIVEAIGSFTDLVIGGIKDWAITKIVTAAITKLVTLFNPAGAIIQAIIATYNTIAFFIERIKQILVLVESIVDSIANIVAGKLSAAANYVERTMARAIPVILGFLARLIGLGDVSGAIRKVIEGIQEKVDVAIDRVIAWVVETGKSLFGRAPTPEAPAAAAGGIAEAKDTFAMHEEPHALRAVVRGDKVEWFMASNGEANILTKIEEIRTTYTNRFEAQRDPAKATRISDGLDAIEQRLGELHGEVLNASNVAAALRAAEIEIKGMLSALGEREGIRGVKFLIPAHNVTYRSSPGHGRAGGAVGDPLSERSRTYPPSPASVDVPGIGLLPGYERGHLVASSLGGRGDEVKNLAPMSGDTNRSASGMQMPEEALRKVLDALGDPPTVLRYHVTPAYDRSGRLGKWLGDDLRVSPAHAVDLFALAKKAVTAPPSVSDLHVALGGAKELPLAVVQQRREEILKRLALDFMPFAFDVSIEVLQAEKGRVLPSPGRIPNHQGEDLS